MTARILASTARLYPSLDRDRWYQVTRTEALGVFIDTGNAERFVFLVHVDLTEGQPAGSST